MFGDSEATSERTPSVRISSDDDLSSHSRLGYSSNNSSVSDRESTSDPSSGKASPSRRRPREVILPDDQSIHDFLVNMSDEVLDRVSGSDGFLITLLKHWHLSHVFIQDLASFCIIRQQYPAHISLWTNDRAPEWFSHTPSWTSLITQSALSGVKHPLILGVVFTHPHILGLALTPHWDTMKPRNFHDDTPNTHLLGFSFISKRQRVSNVSLRSSR